MYLKKKSNYLDISERRVLLRIFDILSVFIGAFLASTFLEVNYLNLSTSIPLQYIITFVLYFILFGNIFEMYNLKISSSRYAIFQSILVTCFTTVMFYIFTPIITPPLPNNRIDILYLFLSIVLPLVYWRIIYSTYIYSPKFLKNIMIIGDSASVENLMHVIDKKSIQINVTHCVSNKMLKGVKNSKFTDIKNADLIKIMNEISVDEIVVSLSSLDIESNSELSKQLVYLFERGVNIKSVSNLYEEITECIAKENLNKEFYKYISFSKNHENRFYLLFMRILDVTLSLIGLSSLIFYIPFVAFGNLFGSKGELFYKQIRVGMNGKHFNIYKFRSMVLDAEQGKPIWAVKNDARITAFGKFIRMTRIDEIPQFWNILKGDMSLIGPRPERPEFVDSLKKDLPFYTIRNAVRPGVTGWAQVMFPYASTIEEQEIKLRYDLYYIKNRGVFMDLKILLKTISTVITFKGQ